MLSRGALLASVAGTVHKSRRVPQSRMQDLGESAAARRWCSRIRWQWPPQIRHRLFPVLVMIQPEQSPRCHTESASSSLAGGECSARASRVAMTVASGSSSGAAWPASLACARACGSSVAWVSVKVRLKSNGSQSTAGSLEVMGIAVDTGLRGMASYTNALTCRCKQGSEGLGWGRLNMKAPRHAETGHNRRCIHAREQLNSVSSNVLRPFALCGVRQRQNALPAKPLARMRVLEPKIPSPRPAPLQSTATSCRS